MYLERDRPFCNPDFHRSPFLNTQLLVRDPVNPDNSLGNQRGGGIDKCCNGDPGFLVEDLDTVPCQGSNVPGIPDVQENFSCPDIDQFYVQLHGPAVPLISGIPAPRHDMPGVCFAGTILIWDIPLYALSYPG